LASERVSFLVVAMLLGAAGRTAAAASADAPTAHLEVDAHPSCSTRDELVARVTARSTRIRFVNDRAGVPSMTARIETGPRGAVIAELTVVEPDGRKFARRIEAPSCAAATDALALVVAITLDPSAVTAEASVVPVGDAGGATSSAATTPPEPPKPDAETVRTGEDAETTPPAVASTRRVTAGVAAAAVLGPAPTVMPGIALEVQAALERASIWSPALVLTLAHVWSSDWTEPAGTAEFTLDLLGLDICPVRVALFQVEARACAAGSLGRLAAQGSNTYDPSSVARPFATAGGTARLALPIGSRVEVRARFGAGATLWRDAFEFTPEVFHRVASVTLVGDVGVGVRFP
jgi:hypothetical protein